ncbi:hypothetical protein [Brazilian marseillevirus]|uniref:hypothetical protein n=1 Tax=Brazilian marseillevirus TaxID=1813599 RepID=UPI00078566DC|nr:hypothetical protein A3303_gp170 [Brazilian marseillevirus]AMQ10678.1 hypothetical protein [Brazilian marseillevirus]
MSKEKKLARQRRYYENHKEEERERLRLWYSTNKDAINEKSKARREAKKEERKKTKRDMEICCEVFQRLFPDIPAHQLEEHLKSLMSKSQ